LLDMVRGICTQFLNLFLWKGVLEINSDLRVSAYLS
jgi:hypothetical protein